MPLNYQLRRTHLRRWAAPCSVAFQLRDTEVLPNVEEEIYPKKLLNTSATGADASIQHPQVRNPTRTPLRRWAAPYSVAFQLRNTEVLPNVEEEIYPKKLLNASAAGGDASI